MATRRHLEKAIKRCPQESCGGTLILQGSRKTNFSGYTCGNETIFECSDCGIRLILTNPNLFMSYICKRCGIKLSKIVKCGDYDFVKYTQNGKIHNCKMDIKIGGWTEHPKIRHSR